MITSESARFLKMNSAPVIRPSPVYELRLNLGEDVRDGPDNPPSGTRGEAPGSDVNK
jgi:hypothetical protein